MTFLNPRKTRSRAQPEIWSFKRLRKVEIQQITGMLFLGELSRIEGCCPLNVFSFTLQSFFCELSLWTMLPSPVVLSADSLTVMHQRQHYSIPRRIPSSPSLGASISSTSSFTVLSSNTISFPIASMISHCRHHC